MKTKNFLALLSCIILISSGYSQSLVSSEGGIFDRVYDRFGNEYQLNDLSLSSTKPIGGATSVNSLPVYSCSAGYFDLYYAAGSCFDGSSQAASDKRTVLCQLFTDISNFINSPLSQVTNTVRINMYCSDTPSNSPLTLGTAGAFYVLPGNPSNPYPGIIQNQIQKAIISGIDPYASIPTSVFAGANNFYHGLVNANVSPVSGTWNYNLNTSSISSSEFDFYSIMLHEVVHALGFGSLIDVNGFSKFGQNNNYYSSYDRFLKDSSGNPLLSGTNSACYTSSLSFQGSTFAIAPGCNTNVATGITTCSSAIHYSSSTVNNISVYTPGCWSGGSSLSHFEDYCSTPSGYVNTCSNTANPTNSFNDLYYVMSDQAGLGNCYLKRYLKPEERYVLCDLGYSVKSSYSSNTNTPVAMIDGTASTHSYSGGACPGLNIWGANDGLVNGAYTFTVSSSITNSIAIPITSSITVNDATTTVGMSCIEVVYNNATTSINSGSLVVTTSVGYQGFVLIKYLPVNSAGELGNPTYIYIYFLPGTCNPPNACDLVQNGGFEQTNSTGPSYGNMGNFPGSAAISCWDYFDGSPDVFRRNTFAPFNLGVNTYNTSPPVDSYNGSPNNAVVGLGGGGNGGSEKVKNNLSAPLTNGTTYQASMWVLNHPNAIANSSLTPLVISIGSIPNFAFTNSTPRNPLIDFTVTTMGSGTNWTHLSGTFTYTLPVNHSAIVVELNGPKTVALGYPIINGFLYFFIDDISIVAMPSPTFAIPNANACGNTSFTNLAQYASPINGVFSGPGVTTTAPSGTTLYHFNAPGTNLSPGNYPINFTYTTSSGCVSTLKQNVTIAPIPTITASSSNYICSNLSNNTSTLSVSCTSCVGATNFVWLPSYQIGNPITVSPTVTTIYTVSPIGGFCTATQTLAVIVQSLCCTQTVTPYASSSTTATTNFTTPQAFNTDISVSPSGWLTLTASEFLFAPNVKLIVKAGAVLTLQGSHLYACTGEMWKGIYMEDGAKVRVLTSSLTYDNLIEDAIIGIDAERTVTSGGTEIELHRTTFNKNHTDISVYGNVYTFIVDNCVFTCRDLPFTSSAWPQTGTASTSTTTAGQLRTVINATTGLNGPYLSGFPTVNLKIPYSAGASHTAIKLANLVVAGTGTVANIGKNTSPSDFNLFDNHALGIFVVNSSLNSINNVFQNSNGANAVSPFIGGGFAKVPGAAITHYITNLMNAKLDISASNVNVGNRFWNCHRSVVASNLFNLDAENVICRSTQSSTNISSVAQGNLGFYASTNRFHEYYITNCEFTNINNAINTAITSGQYSTTSTYYGTYANRMRIIYNTFSAGTSSNSYMNNAVIVTGYNNVPYYSPSTTVTPFTQAVVVQGNTISDAYRGISVNGITGFQTQIENNDVSLKEDNVFYASQHAIRMDNCNPASGISLGKNIIASNNLEFGVSTSYTNNLGSLVYCANNGYGMASPSITCNNLSKSYQGFVFDGPNSGALWAGNLMDLPMTRGFELNFGGYINTQGGSNMAINNAWLGGTWSGNYKGTYVNAGSSATASVLWVGNSSTTYPPNPGGNAQQQDRYDPGAGNIQTTGVASYNCEGIPNARVVNIPYESDFATNEQFYIAKTAFYRFLSYNDSLVASDSLCADFYDNLSGTSIDQFAQVEAQLMLGDFVVAASLNQDIEPTNSIETNYKNYYSLYLSLAADDFNYNADDSLALEQLCSLCPGTNGASIYQARALYNYVFKKPYIYFPCIDEEGARFLNNQKDEESNSSMITNWDFDIFPNPATNQISIINKFRSDLLKIELKDLTGKVIEHRNLNSTEFITNLELEFINGVYFVTVTNSKGDKLTKKLVIVK